MDAPVDLVEFEAMLLTRYTLNPRYRSGNGLIERSAYLLLSRLASVGPQTIRELGDALRLDASTLNRQTGSLLRNRLVERIADPDGGIARKFRLTEFGNERLHAARTANVEGMTRVMEGWPAEDVAAFAAYLRRFNFDIERLDGRPWPRPGLCVPTPAAHDEERGDRRKDDAGRDDITGATYRVLDAGPVGANRVAGDRQRRGPRQAAREGVQAEPAGGHFGNSSG